MSTPAPAVKQPQDNPFVGFFKNLANNQMVKSAISGMQGIPQDITNGVNAVGQAAGSQPLFNNPLPFFGNPIGPTVRQAADALNGTNSDTPIGIPGVDILHGQATPMSILGLLAMKAGGGENPEGDINPEAIANDTTVVEQIPQVSKAQAGDVKYLAQKALNKGDISEAHSYWQALPDGYQWKEGMRSFFGKLKAPEPAAPPANPAASLNPEASTAPGVILGPDGNPIASKAPSSSPTAMGSYVRDANGNLVQNQNPQTAQYATDTTTNTPPPASGAPLPQNAQESVVPPPVSKAPVSAPTRTFTPSANPAKGEVLANQQRNIQIDGQDIKTPNDVAQINATLNGYGIKGTPTEQLQMANDTLGKLSQRAQNIVASEGGATPKANLVSEISQNLSYSNNHNIPAAQTNIAASNYIDNVYTRAVGGDVTRDINGVTPANIPDTVLQKMKTIMNQDAQSTFNQPDPTKWTTNQTVSRFGRNAVDNVLDAAHPGASQLNNDMSDLYKAQESLRKGANTDSTNAAKAANAAPKTFGDRVGDFFKNPLVDVGLGVAGVTGAKELPGLVSNAVGGGAALFQNMFNSSKNQGNGNNNDNPFKNPPQGDNGSVSKDINHGQTVAQGGLNVNPQPDKNGYYHVSTQPQSDANYMTDAQRVAAEKAISPYDPAYGNKVAEIERQYNAGQSRATNALSGEKLTFMQPGGAQYFLDAGNKLKDQFAAAPTNLLGNLKGYKDVQAYLSSNPNAPYQKELTDIGKLNTMYSAAVRMVTGEKLNPDDAQLLQPGDSAKQAYLKWDSMMKFVKSNYDANLPPYLALTSGTATNNDQSQPVPAPTGAPAPASHVNNDPSVLQQGAPIPAFSGGSPAFPQ